MAGGRGSGRHLVLMGSVAVAVLAADQLSKSWAVERLSGGHTIDLIGSLRFNLAFNSGAAFSSGTGFGPVIAVLAILLVAALLWTGRSATSKLSAVAVGLIVGGALGNLTDRLLRGEGPGGFLGGAAHLAVPIRAAGNCFRLRCENHDTGGIGSADRAHRAIDRFDVAARELAAPGRLVE